MEKLSSMGDEPMSECDTVLMGDPPRNCLLAQGHQGAHDFGPDPQADEPMSEGFPSGPIAATMSAREKAILERDEARAECDALRERVAELESTLEQERHGRFTAWNEPAQEAE